MASRLVVYHRPYPQREHNVFSSRLCLFGGIGLEPIAAGESRIRAFRDDSYLLVSFSSMRRLRRRTSSVLPSSRG